jgi:hypothetical protein
MHPLTFPQEGETAMTEKPNPEPENIDWSRVETRSKARSKEGGTSESELVVYPLERAENAPTHSIVPAAVAVTLPDTETPRGILLQWKKNKIDRRTALQAIQAQYDSQLDALRYQLQKAVSVSNARADRLAEEFLKKLDSEHIQVLKDLGLRNAETRATALIEVRDMIAAKLKEVQTKKWPPSLVDRTIDDLLDLEKRVCAEMMKELGS